MFSNYEIMIISDPKEDIKNVEQWVKEIFKSDEVDFKKLSFTTLAYLIKNSQSANYFLVNVKTNSDNIKEFIRKSKICKFIWRQMVINLNSERAMDSLKNMNKLKDKKPFFENFKYKNNSRKILSENK